MPTSIGRVIPLLGVAVGIASGRVVTLHLRKSKFVVAPLSVTARHRRRPDPSLLEPRSKDSPTGLGHAAGDEAHHMSIDHEHPIGVHGAEGRRSILGWLPALVTDVHAEEMTTALLMTLNGFVLLMAYSCIKPVREALILEHPGGAEYKVYMAAATAVVLLGAVPAYSRISRHLPRNRLVVGVTLFFASHLVAFYALAATLGNTLPLALGFYLWIAVFNMMIVAQFWAFANDLYTESAGTRLFPLFGLGISLGAVAGAAVATTLIRTVGSLEMMPVAALLLVASAGITQWAASARSGTGA